MDYQRQPAGGRRIKTIESFVLPFPNRNSVESRLSCRNSAVKSRSSQGGSRGIGAGIARRLAADGASVAITYTKGSDAAASVVKEIERAGGKAIAIQADATDAQAVRAAVGKGRGNVRPAGRFSE